MELKTYGIGVGLFAIVFYGLTFAVSVTGWNWLRVPGAFIGALGFVCSVCGLIDMIKEIKKGKCPPMTFGEWLDS